MICYCTLISTFLVLFQVVYSLPTKYSDDDLERLLELLYNKGRKGHKTPMDRWKNGRAHLISGDLKKPELVLNSLAQDYGERQLDYLPDGAHKPKNLNRHNKQEQSAEEKDVHKVSTHVEIPNSATKRNYYHDIGWRWPNRTVYYAIDYPSFSPFIAQAEDKIKSSLALLEDAACIKWEDVTGTSTAYNHILFYGNTTACASYVGYIKTKEQKIWLGPGCLWTSIVLHEVLHALGAWHEQQRTDREGNIDMLFQNINPHALGNFELRQTREYAPFDLGSILQYGLSSFATQTGLQTMSIPDKGLEYLITNSKNDLSFYDKLNLNRYYDCAATCSLSCLNGGFEKMNYLGVCSCECPDGLIGLDCSQLDTSPGCGGFIDLTTPGTSQVIEMTSYNTNLLCTWLIKTPVKTKVKATIEQLDLPDSENNNCFHFLIFRDYLIGEPGKQACGNTSGAVYSKYLHGEENMMMIRFDSISYPDVTPGSGFRVKVEAMPSGCYSHPCKFGATCHEQSSVDQYTCSCPQGFSGKNCEIVTATAIVRSTFEQDFTGSVFQQDPTSTFWWSIVSKHNFGGTTVYPHSGNLFASMIGYLSVIYLHTTSKLRTEAKFQAAERCLNISYIMDNQTHPTYPEYFTKFIVTVLDGENVLNEYTYFGDTGTKWRHKLVDLPAVNDLRVEITGVFGWNTLGIDDLLILPAPCDCVSHQCLHGHCVSNGGTYTCHCQTGYSGDYCEILDVVDGGYTEWSVWTTCTTTCGEGTQTRTRTCTNPTPMNGGSDCVGESNQSQSCQIQACPVDGGYTEWSAWSTCDCVEGTQTRTRTCTNPTPANGGSDCVGESSQTQTCTAEGCQIDGGYTEWSVWSTCTATCGEGTQTRTRTCTNPIPQNGGADCDGEGSQTQSCNIQGCPIDGGYTEWSAWSMCDCVEGTQTRTRTCTNPTPANGGSDCVGESSQTQTCTAEGCQIDGGYTEWSAWSTCTATCGEGTQTRTRTCTHPIPQNGGADCDGEGSQTQSCNIQGCPITSSHCDFEQEYEENCFLKEGNNDDFDWTRNFGGTETQRTGPGRARSGYYYKYIESTGKQSGATAELVSNGVFANATYCFSFYNHMKGKHIGSLEVLIVEDGIEHTVTLLDTNRKGWYMNSSNLQLHNRTKLIIRATVGSGDKGDIAVDDISLSLGAC
ncbi:uncharacterized protein LOC125663930 isoform X2 [Ostrea edulis]|uniref:uncharacterized protein LOC125663930 isoform X2 n=1 Tax=Ostrea edulis TaxID=37623 RepID=UPI0024AF402F|nr:uncharacterized protein LOC125663930 isoform X2 [Ostrea edulis]